MCVVVPLKGQPDTATRSPRCVVGIVSLPARSVCPLWVFNGLSFGVGVRIRARSFRIDGETIATSRTTSTTGFANRVGINGG